MRILDVGSGNGAKAIYFAKILSEKGLEVRIDSIEPKEKQRQALRTNHENEGRRYMGNIYETALERTLLSETYDFILLFHSLYEFPRNDYGTICSFGKLCSLLSDQGAGIIVIEGPEGDFQRLKHELYPTMGKKMPVSETVIRKTLESSGMTYRKGEPVEFEFFLGDIASFSDYEVGKNLEFLFSDSLDSRLLSESELSAIGEWVRKHSYYDSDKESTCLWTPNTVLWFYAAS